MDLNISTQSTVRPNALSMDPNAFVVGWLSRLELTEGPAIKGHESGIERPNTPEGQYSVTSAFDEPSPTNTNFSSVFDTPERRASVSPSPSIVSATSVGDDENNNKEWDTICRDSICAAQPLLDDSPEELSAAEDKLSINSYDPPSELDESHIFDHLNEPSSLDAIDSPQAVDTNRSQQVFITSCYQCILAGLPCSRTTPSCSRCKRAGCAHVCLLHRRKLLREKVPGEVEWNRTPMLLRLRGEDDATWGAKMEALQELHQTWLDREDRKNWVLPSPVSEVRGGLSPTKSMRNRLYHHPGEGLGRLTFQQLELA